MEQTIVVESKLRVKIQLSVKGERYGEYSFKGDTKEELNANGIIAKAEFEKHLKG